MYSLPLITFCICPLLYINRTTPLLRNPCLNSTLDKVIPPQNINPLSFSPTSLAVFRLPLKFFHREGKYGAPRRKSTLRGGLRFWSLFPIDVYFPQWYPGVPLCFHSFFDISPRLLSPRPYRTPRICLAFIILPFLQQEVSSTLSGFLLV